MGGFAGCQKPKDLGYAQELWTTRLLAEHIRKHSMAAGHPSLSRLGRGTVSKILRANQVQPHRIQYYLERRDPEFDTRWCRCCMCTRKWRSGAKKARLRRI